MTLGLPFTTVDGLVAFLLVFFRITGVVVIAPLFANQLFPVRLRVWLSFLVAAVVFPLAWSRMPEGLASTVFRQPSSAALAVGGELAIGWLLGWTASVMIWGAQLAGHIIGQEIGLSIGEVFDPVTGTQASPTTQLFMTIGMLVFILLNGHHLVLIAATRSFEVAPIGTFPFGKADGLFLTSQLGGEIWRMGLRVALPTMVALLLVTVAMAILARAVPEMNIFILGFALRILFGLLGVFLMMPFVVDVMKVFVGTTETFLAKLLALWGGG